MKKKAIQVSQALLGFAASLCEELTSSKVVKSCGGKVALLLLLAVFSTAAAWGDIFPIGPYRSIKGTAGANNNQSCDELFDNNTNTKWCILGFNGYAYVEFTTDLITPKGYRLTTGDDNETNPGRNPKSWVLKAKADEDDPWTVLSTVTNDWKMKDLNKKDYNYYFVNTMPFRYYRLEITDLQEGDVFQLSELKLLLAQGYANNPYPNNYLAEVDPFDIGTATVMNPQVFRYTGHPINFSTTLLDVNGNVLPDDAYYTFIFDANDDTETFDPDKIKEIGDYLFQCSAIAGRNYNGTLVFPFSVGLWEGKGGYCGNPDKNGGKNVLYDIVTENDKKVLYIRKNLTVGSWSDFSMRGYFLSNIYNEWAQFAPWITVNTVYEKNNNGDDIFRYHELSSDFKKVVVEDGVTAIGGYAFYFLQDIESISLPTSLKTIDYAAFNECKKLQSVVIPSSVITIDIGAFWYCHSLTSVTIPCNMERIVTFSFSGCSSLTDVYCYANPDVDWDEDRDAFMADGSTKIHVHNDAQWDNRNLHATIVGDLPTTITLTANENDGLYWTTLHTGPMGYRINADEQACAYTATYSSSYMHSGLTLHKLGKVIPAGTAVIIASNDNSVTLTADKSPAEYPNALKTNKLHGLYEPLPLSTVKTMYGADNIYVMGKPQNGSFGFHRYTGANVPAGKAFFALKGTAALAPSLTLEFDDDEATSLLRTPVATGQESDDSWYTLSGQRLSARPTAKGLYIHNGRKEVIR